MSAVEEALLINAIVLIAVLQADLGPHRSISLWRILRPILLMCVIVPIYLMSPARHGLGLTLELAATAIGIVLGLAVSLLVHVYRSPRTGRPVSRAGVAYAAVWIAVIGARSAFSYGAQHWFGPQLGTWMAQHMVTVSALTDAILLMAVAMVVTRTLSLGVRASRLTAPKHRLAPA